MDSVILERTDDISYGEIPKKLSEIEHLQCDIEEGEKIYSSYTGLLAKYVHKQNRLIDEVLELGKKYHCYSSVKKLIDDITLRES